MNKYTLTAGGKVIDTFETAQDAMDWGHAYYPQGYSVK